MGDFRARKKPPPRGEGVAGLRGERQSLLRIAHQVRIPNRAGDNERIGAILAVLPLMRIGAVAVAFRPCLVFRNIPTRRVLGRGFRALVVEDAHDLVIRLALEKCGREVGRLVICHTAAAGEPAPEAGE